MNTILVTNDGPVGRIQLNRPEKYNAISTELMREVGEAVQSLGADESVVGIVLAGTEKYFSTGADLDEALTIQTPQQYGDYNNTYWIRRGPRAPVPPDLFRCRHQVRAGLRPHLHRNTAEEGPSHRRCDRARNEDRRGHCGLPVRPQIYTMRAFMRYCNDDSKAASRKLDTVREILSRNYPFEELIGSISFPSNLFLLEESDEDAALVYRESRSTPPPVRALFFRLRCACIISHTWEELQSSNRLKVLRSNSAASARFDRNTRGDQRTTGSRCIGLSDPVRPPRP